MRYLVSLVFSVCSLFPGHASPEDSRVYPLDVSQNLYAEPAETFAATILLRKMAILSSYPSAWAIRLSLESHYQDILAKAARLFFSGGSGRSHISGQMDLKTSICWHLGSNPKLLHLSVFSLDQGSNFSGFVWPIHGFEVEMLRPKKGRFLECSWDGGGAAFFILP